MPDAKPDTTVKLSSTSDFTSFVVLASPSLLGLRVPTTATEGDQAKSQMPT